MIDDDLFIILKEMSEILNRHKIRWCLGLNSVLGAVRQNNFVSAWGISAYLIGITNSAYYALIKEFKEHNFSLHHIEGNPSTIKRETAQSNEKQQVEQKKLKYLDIEFHRIEKGSGDYAHYYRTRHLMYHEKFFDTLTIGNIRGFEVPLPNHTEELLEVYYTDTWRTPMKNIHSCGKAGHMRCVERFNKGI